MLRLRHSKPLQQPPLQHLAPRGRRIRTTITITTTTTAVADGTRQVAAGRVGPFRAASVSRIGMVRGTSMEGGRATTDINICGGRFGGLLFFGLCTPAVRIAPSNLHLSSLTNHI